MKTFLWTTLFRLLVVVGFVFYMKSFDADMANGVCTWLGATEVAVQDTLATGTADVTLTDIQEMLTDMQTTLNDMAGVEETIPVVEVESVVEETPEVTAE